ncbi:MAG TPA: tetratricopeptide repeat protein [Alphaproteobacteria bacterium]|nr:tetratricopeptide repeat protein [Alphaproteobacteria bacterium]
MKRLAAAAAVIFMGLFASTAHADLARGRAAFEQGNYTLAYQELIPDAQTGNGEAEYLIGEMAADGLGMSRSYALAARWYAMAARAGYEPANLTLGLLYLHGAGDEDDPTAVAADPSKAVPYIQAAAHSGDRNAEYLLGQLYFQGTGVPQDFARAYEYTLKAANAALPEAEYNAGIMALKGAGTTANPVEAYKWFALAAAAHYPGAEQNRQAVLGQLSPEDAVKAKALVDAFRPTP